MKTNKLRKLVWALFALTLTTTNVFAQGWRYTNGTNQNQNNWLNAITGLNENQKNQILEMEETHQKNMDEMRTQQRSTVDFEKKSEIRNEMTKMVANHRSAVKNLLTQEQQEQYDLLHMNPNYRNQQNFANRGNRNFQGRGQFAGNRQFNRGNGRMYAQNNVACGGNGARFANQNNMGRRNARFNQCGNFQRGNGRLIQQNQLNNSETTEENK